MSNWLFHGNPKRFPVLDHLRQGESDIDWLITQHLDDVSISDNAALWMSGPSAGVYAIGYIAGAPYDGAGSEDWVESDDQGHPGNFCPLRWTDNLVDRPVLKTDLLAAGGFEKTRVIRQPCAGNPMLLTAPSGI